jgi:hypothetical protein
LFPDGSFNHTPDPGFTGTDSFAFYASDGYLAGVDPEHPSGAQPSIVTIDVLPPGPGNSARVPVLRDEYYRVVAIRPAIPEDAPLLDGRTAYKASLVTGFEFKPALVRPQAFSPSGDVLALDYANIQITTRYATSVSTSPVTGIHIDGLEPDNALMQIYTFDIDLDIILMSIRDISVELSITYANNPPPDVINSVAGEDLLSNLATVHLIIDLSVNQMVLASPTGTVILESPLETALSNVRFISPLPLRAPAGIGIAWLLDFTVNYPPFSPYGSGFPVLVTIVLPRGSPHVTTYYKYGPTRQAACLPGIPSCMIRRMVIRQAPKL